MYPRKKNYRNTIVVLIGLMMTSSFLTAQNEIGLQLYTFRNQIPKDIPGMLEKNQQDGYQGT